MMNNKEKKSFILRTAATVLIALVVLSIIRTLIIHQDLLRSDFSYMLFIQEAVFSIISALIITLLLFLSLREDLKKINIKAHNYAFTDGLTGLYNRHYLNDFLEKFDVLQKENSMFAVIFIDIDKFKEINDTIGHLAGDCILKSLALRLKYLTQDADILCRYGGEEFVIICSDISEENIVQKAQKIREEIQNSIFECEHVNITISIGLSFGKKGYDINSVINEADEALYIAKKSGRNCLIVFDNKKEAA